MTRIAALCLALTLALAPADAQETAPDRDGDIEEGLNLLGEGMRLFFKGLGDELEPAMRDFAEAMEPALARLMELIDDMDAYELPEKLPNGDIIIRRKPDAPETPEVVPDGEIEI